MSDRLTLLTSRLALSPLSMYLQGWTENLPILRDFVPYRGQCPANYLMPLGDDYIILVACTRLNYPLRPSVSR